MVRHFDPDESGISVRVDKERLPRPPNDGGLAMTPTQGPFRAGQALIPTLAGMAI